MANRALLALVGVFLFFGLLFNLLAGLLRGLGVPEGWEAPGVGLLSLLAFLGLYRFWLRVGARQLEELREGYTTLTLMFGGFRMGALRRWKGSGHRPPWDYGGVWLLNRAGEPVEGAPDRSVLPPGLYPSPHREGEWELWTGCVWSGEFYPPARLSLPGLG